MFNLKGMASNAWNLAKWGATSTRATPWLLGGAGVLGLGGILGMANPRQSTFGGMGTVAGQATSGAISGGIIGGLYGGIRMGYGSFRGTRPLGAASWIGASAIRYGLRGAGIGAGIGATSGLFRAGLSGNRPVNPISSISARNRRLKSWLIKNDMV